MQNNINKPFFLSNLVKQATIDPLETRLQKKKKAQRNKAMADKSTPSPTTSTTPLTLLEASTGKSTT